MNFDCEDRTAKRGQCRDVRGPIYLYCISHSPWRTVQTCDQYCVNGVGGSVVSTVIVRRSSCYVINNMFCVVLLTNLNVFLSFSPFF